MFTLNVLLGAGLGFVAGAFAPGVLRKVKSLFVKETKTLEGIGAQAVQDVTKKL